MKTLLIVLLSFVSFNCFSQWEAIKGNGNVKKETREASGYTGVSLSGSMNVELSYGNSNTITIEADENLLPYITTKVENGILVIKAKDKANLKSDHKLMVYVSATTLTQVTVAGSGNISGKGAFSNPGKTSISLSGSGNINLSMDSFNETKVSIAGSGNIVLNGKSTNNIDANISGSGNIDASGLSCNDVFAHVSGSGNIKVYANKSIDAKVSGSGNVYYKGSASNVNMKASGSGKIIKV